MRRYFNKFFGFLERNYSIVLLLSLLIFLFIIPFADESFIGVILGDVSILLVVFSGYILVPVERRTPFFKILFSFISIGVILSIIGVKQELRLFSLACWVIFFFKVFYQIFRLSLKKNHPAKESLVNSISGYLVLGIMGAIVFIIIQHFEPHSFATKLPFSDLVYYSFVTMSTLGYGDVLPLEDGSKYAAICLTVTGQLYIAVVIALNLAKYMTVLNSDKSDLVDRLSSIDQKLKDIDQKLKDKK
jgi:hypothetical protein